MKNAMRNGLLLGLICAVPLFAVEIVSEDVAIEGSASTISSEEIELAATHWMAASPAFNFAVEEEAAGQAPVVKSVTPIVFNGTAQAWRVDLSPRGYLVMASDQRMTPVLAFSVTSDLNLEPSEDNALRSILIQDLGENLALLDALDSEPQADASGVQDQIEQNRSLWSQLMAGEQPSAFLSDALVTNIPPLMTTAWDQTKYFNDLMPSCSGVGSPYNGHAPAGCGSIAAAQIYKYFNWPYRGTGRQSYSDDGTTRATSLYRVYDWDSMLDRYIYSSTYPASNTTAIATFIRDAGYAMEMDYGCSVSTSYNQSYADAANRFFYYAQCVSRTWNESLASAEITARRPLQVSYDESSGHMLVADGVADDGGTTYFHINYGWGGSQDGWYRPNSLYGSASLDYMTPGVEPLFKPLLTNAFDTVESTSFTLEWDCPAWHATNISHYYLVEGTQGVSGTFSDSTASFDNWWNSEFGWKISSGAFFYCATNTHQGFVQLEVPLIPTSSSTLQYDYRRSLSVANHVYVEVSDDLGETWDTLAYYGGQVYETSFNSASHSLSAYAGKPLYLRIRFRHNRGYWGWYGASKETAGIYIDDIQVSNCYELNWAVVANPIDASTNCFLVTNRFSGTYYYNVIAQDNSAVDHAAPLVCEVTVDLPEFSFKAFAMTNNVVLRWPDPAACGMPNSTVMVRRATGTYPATTGDGTGVYTGTNVIHTDNELTPGTCYYYTIWVNDGSSWVDPPE